MSPPGTRGLVVAALVLASGCLSPLPGIAVSDPDAVERATETRIQTDPPVLIERVNVTVELHVEEPIRFTDNSGAGSDWDVWIEDTNGSRVAELVRPGALPGPAVLTEQTLEAGVHTWAFPWNGRTGPADENGTHEGSRVGAGTYEIHAVRSEIDVTFAGSGEIEVAPAETG